MHVACDPTDMWSITSARWIWNTVPFQKVVHGVLGLESGPQYRTLAVLRVQAQAAVPLLDRTHSAQAPTLTCTMSDMALSGSGAVNKLASGELHLILAPLAVSDQHVTGIAPVAAI